VLFAVVFACRVFRAYKAVYVDAVCSAVVYKASIA
jgi:hypothetical protein